MHLWEELCTNAEHKIADNGNTEASRAVYSRLLRLGAVELVVSYSMSGKNELLKMLGPASSGIRCDPLPSPTHSLVPSL